VRRIVVGKPEGKRPLGRSRPRWKDDDDDDADDNNTNKVDVNEIGCESVAGLI
jgi:hypothetical protein